MKAANINMNKRGFTLIELVLVITILGILAVAALPSFVNVSTSAEQSAMAGVIGAVRTGIAIFRVNLIATGAPASYPSTLDSMPASSICGPTRSCFSTVLSQGVTDPSWSTGATVRTYIFNQGGGVTYTYTYDNVAGTITSPTAP